MWVSIARWFRSLQVLIVLNWKKFRSMGIRNFLNDGSLQSHIEDTNILLPFDPDIRYKKWIVIRDTGQVAVIDHYKSDGRIGVRPVDPVTAAYLPNSSKHWSWEDRLRIPHELALTPGKIREASEDEIPYIVRK